MSHFKCSQCGREVSVFDIWHRFEDGKKVYYCTRCIRPMVDEHYTNGFVIGA